MYASKLLRFPPLSSTQKDMCIYKDANGWGLAFIAQFSFPDLSLPIQGGCIVIFVMTKISYTMYILYITPATIELQLF